MAELGKYFTACGKEYDRLSKVKGHERLCQKCKDLGTVASKPSVEDAPVLDGVVLPTPTPEPRCARCNGPLQVNEITKGICSVCENELILESNATQRTPPPAISPVVAPPPQPEVQAMPTAMPDMVAITEQLNKITEAVNKLAENQVIIHQQLTVLKPVIDHIQTQAKAESGEVAVAPAEGNGQAQASGGSFLKDIGELLKSIGVGKAPTGPNTQMDMFNAMMKTISEAARGQIEIFRAGSDFASGLISSATKTGANPGDAADILKSNSAKIIPQREPNV